MIGRLLGLAAMRRMGPLGKAMIAAQVGSAAYAFYKQRKARGMAAPGSEGRHRADDDRTRRRSGRFDPFR